MIKAKHPCETTASIAERRTYRCHTGKASGVFFRGHALMEWLGMRAWEGWASPENLELFVWMREGREWKQTEAE
jgi:hypothetical protein